MKINLDGIVIIVGNYGSGKTEVCINLAVHHKRKGLNVFVADLDLVNPYFRTREARGQLSELGIKMVLPPEQYLQADLPILTPAVAGMIRQSGSEPQHEQRLILLDVGGNDVGATVLATLADPLKDKKIRMLQVVNPFRPFTDTVQGCLKIRDEIENASKLKINGIIGNGNLIDETTAADIYKGYDLVHAFSEESGLPLECITVSAELLPKTDIKYFSCPVLPIERQLVPWKKRSVLSVPRLRSSAS